MSIEEHGNRSASELAKLEEEAHLLDPGSLAAVAAWIVTAAAAGVIGNTAYDLLRAVRRRGGSARLDELRQRVYEEMKQVRRKNHLSNQDLQLRVDRLFDELDS